MVKIFAFVSFLAFNYINAQDTYSIIAIDPVTGDIGGAGASCLDLTGFGFQPGFISDLIPGIGGANTQAYYLGTNQRNARNRINRKDSAHVIVEWLKNNDIEQNPDIRQYGIVTFIGNTPQAASFTGISCDDYKGHITGPNYSIQGNILLGPQILDSMEANFLRTEGNLACKLMAALQGAKVIGADTRCIPNESSALFAFVKVTKPTDTYNKPYFSLGVITRNGEKIEPVDSLQKLFDTSFIKCTPNTISNHVKSNFISLSFNVVEHDLILNANKDFSHQQLQVYILNAHGEVVKRVLWNTASQTYSIQVDHLSQGFYTLSIFHKNKIQHLKWIKI